MKSRTLFAAALILLAPLVVLAFQAESEQVRKGELSGRSFSAGPLKITLAELYGGGILKSYGDLIIEVQNTSEDFAMFDPRQLSFIDKDDNQTDILGVAGSDRRQWAMAPAESKRIGPKAKTKNFYELTDKLRLPVRLYYGEKLLVTIIE